MISNILVITAIVLFILSFFINNKKEKITDRIDQQAIETSKRLNEQEDRIQTIETRVNKLEKSEEQSAQKTN